MSPRINPGMELETGPAAKVANTSCSSSFDSTPFDTSFDPVAFFGDANVLPESITTEAALCDDDVDASNLATTANCFDSILSHAESLEDANNSGGPNMSQNNDCNNHPVANLNSSLSGNGGVVSSGGMPSDRPSSAVESTATFSTVEDENNGNVASPPNISSNVDFELDQLLDQNSHSDFNVRKFWTSKVFFSVYLLFMAIK